MVYDVPDCPESLPPLAGPAGALPAVRGAAPGVFVQGASRRGSLEAFIAARFEKAYGAEVAHYCRHLVGLPAAGHGWRAAVGYTGAHEAILYVEHYLDAPVEVAIERSAGRPVTRAQVAEVGNLAATSPGAAREIIAAMHAHLRGAGFAWVAFTATRELRNTFARLGLPLRFLAPADARRVPGGGAGWGSYYAHDPIVMLGALGEAHEVAA